MEALKKRFRSTYTSEQLPSYTQPYDAVAIRPKDKPAPWIDDPEPWSPLRIGIAQIKQKKIRYANWCHNHCQCSGNDLPGGL